MIVRRSSWSELDLPRLCLRPLHLCDYIGGRPILSSLLCAPSLSLSSSLSMPVFSHTFHPAISVLCPNPPRRRFQLLILLAVSMSPSLRLCLSVSASPSPSPCRHLCLAIPVCPSLYFRLCRPFCSSTSTSVSTHSLDPGSLSGATEAVMAVRGASCVPLTPAGH